LAGEKIIKFGVARLRIEAVEVIGEWLRNEIFILRAKDNGDELRRPALGMVNFERDELAFPIYSPALLRLFVPAESTIVSLGANQQNKRGPLKLV
jgi:hypothetical protein